MNFWMRFFMWNLPSICLFELFLNSQVSKEGDFLKIPCFQWAHHLFYLIPQWPLWWILKYFHTFRMTSCCSYCRSHMCEVCSLVYKGGCQWGGFRQCWLLPSKFWSHINIYTGCTCCQPCGEGSIPHSSWYWTRKLNCLWEKTHYQVATKHILSCTLTNTPEGAVQLERPAPKGLFWKPSKATGISLWNTLS